MKLAAIAVALCLAAIGAACGTDPVPVSCALSEVTTESGLRYRDVECGAGEAAAGGLAATIAYTATYEGRPFDATSGLTFPVGRGQVLAGLDEGVRGMKVGGKRHLVISANLAYGEAGFPPDVGPGATIELDVTLLELRAIEVP